MILIPADKANHFIGGALIALVVLLASRQWGILPTLQPADLALAAAALAGIGKEAIDKALNMRAAAAGQTLPHGVEGYDILATVAGGALVWAAAS
jgi:hypothetical protein